MRRLALYVAFKYAGAAGILLAFLWRLGYPSPLGMVWLPLAAGIHVVLLGAICPPALRPRKRQPSGRLVTGRGIVFIIGGFAFLLGGVLVSMELRRAGLITFVVKPGTQVISSRLVVGLLLVVSALSVGEFAMKKDKLDRADEADT
jgi:hypothetical protein